jgi:hypothetical protein
MSTLAKASACTIIHTVWSWVLPILGIKNNTLMDGQRQPTDPNADQHEGKNRKKKKKPVPQPPSDPRLDLTSPEFDAELALGASTGVQLPVPDAPVLDNISRCAGMLQLPEEQQPAQQQQQSIEVRAESSAHDHSYPAGTSTNLDSSSSGGIPLTHTISIAPLMLGNS